MLYPAPQLRLLIAIAGALLIGLGVSHWRARFPALADRIEGFDAAGPAAAVVVEEGGAAPPAPGASPASRPHGGDAGRAETPARGGTPAPIVAPPLDLNRATAEQLAGLPGVGPVLAQRIVDERERRGGFDSPDGLRRVLGLGPKKLAMLRDLVTTGAAPAPSVPPGPPRQDP
jgi:competence protein ComEA